METRDIRESPLRLDFEKGQNLSAAAEFVGGLSDAQHNELLTAARPYETGAIPADRILWAAASWVAESEWQSSTSVPEEQWFGDVRDSLKIAADKLKDKQRRLTDVKPHLGSGGGKAV